MRFCRQPSWYSCGPTAIINAAKWSGMRCQLRVYHTAIARLCKSDYALGTNEVPFEKTLRLFLSGRVRIKKRRDPSFASVVGHLRQDGTACVLLYWKKMPKGDVAGHYILLIPNDDDSAIAVNDSLKTTTVVVSNDELKRRLMFMRGERDGPKVWFLRRI